MKHHRVWSTTLSWIVAAGMAALEARGAGVDFAKEIDPILVKRCSECHGPDQQKGNLRLDTRAGSLRAGKSGKSAVVPGKPDESEILRRVLTDDSDDRMPPKGERLNAAEVDALRRWIAEGALWPEWDPKNHWAFRKPQRAPLPEPGKHPIDAFVSAKLKTVGLELRPEADVYTLLRRVSLDLTGLPPQWSDVEKARSTWGPGSYERWVDRLLESPAFGEHWGRWWLDLARYADSNGYQVDLARSMWPYRDWVMDALNRNMPFDQFTIEQLAGDLLPNPSLSQLVATGFHRNTKINDEGGGDAEEYRTKAVKDRVSTTATTWLGLTLMCSECHSHKYDPLSQDEYYQFYAFFNNTSDGGNYSVEPTVTVPAPDIRTTVNHVRERQAEVRRQLADAEEELNRERKNWESTVRQKGKVWTPLTISQTVSVGGSSYTNLADHSVLATGVNPIYDTITFEAEADAQGATAILLEVLPDPTLPKNGPGRWGATGNFILDEFSAWVSPEAAAAAGLSTTNLTFSTAVADWEQTYYRAEHAVDRNPKTGWAIGPRFGQRHFLIATLREPIRTAGRIRMGFRFEHYHGNSHTIGRFRVSLTREADPRYQWPAPPELAETIAGERSGKIETDVTRTAMAAFHRNSSGRIRALEAELLRLNQRERELASTKYSTLVLQERGERRKTFVHQRGSFLDPGKEVTPDVPAILGPLPKGVEANRLALARWLVSTNNPITARVTVNRVWERVFGTGIVKTGEDFGRQGEAPTHPELLDWLAVEWMQPSLPGAQHPWDVKHLLRQIVLSAAYRQDAAADPVRLEKDPFNRLLSRGARFRVDGETVRDIALRVSGLLDTRFGGPSVYPVQVANLWKEIGFLRPEIGMDEWPLSSGPDLYRRGVYTFWRRVCTYPTFATFDAPSRDVCTGKRPRTNTPLQALAGLNDPTLLEAARVFGQRILTEGGPTTAARVEFAFRTALGRPPNPIERARLLDYASQQLKAFEADSKAAAELIEVGSAVRPRSVSASELAAWMMVANVLLNLDETLTKG